MFLSFLYFLFWILDLVILVLGYKETVKDFGDVGCGTCLLDLDLMLPCV